MPKSNKQKERRRRKRQGAESNGNASASGVGGPSSDQSGEHDRTPSESDHQGPKSQAREQGSQGGSLTPAQIRDEPPATGVYTYSDLPAIKRFGVGAVEPARINMAIRLLTELSLKAGVDPQMDVAERVDTMKKALDAIAKVTDTELRWEYKDRETTVQDDGIIIDASRDEQNSSFKNTSNAAKVNDLIAEIAGCKNEIKRTNRRKNK